MEKANQLFGNQGYNLNALATPARRIDPEAKNYFHPQWADLLDNGPKDQGKQARELKQYANLVLDLDLKKIRVGSLREPTGPRYPNPP